MTEPDDRELEQYLKGDSALSRRYREASGETAPPELDEAILARARAEARRPPPSLNRMLAPVALAASVLLGVNLAWNLKQVEPLPPMPAEVPAPVVMPERDAVREEPSPRPASPQAKAEARQRAAAPPAAEYEAEARLDDRPGIGTADPVQAEEREALAKRIETQQRAAKMKDEAGVAAPVVDSAPAAAMAEPQARTPLESTARAWSEANETLPAGWHLFGDAQLYDASTDESVAHSPPSSLAVWRVGPGVERCGRLETEVAAKPLLGKAVRVTAVVRTQGTSSDSRMSLFAAYGRGGAIEPWRHQWFAATAVWTPQAVVIEVPNVADRIVYGALLCGPGSLWIDDVELSVVTR